MISLKAEIPESLRNQRLFKHIVKRMRDAVERDGFELIIIEGPRGYGKSVLALWLAAAIYGDWGKVFDYTVFTLSDYDFVITNKKPSGQRIPLIIWDDFAVHMSSYSYWDSIMIKRLKEWVEEFQAVREDLAVLIITVATVTLLPKPIRHDATFYLYAKERFHFQVFRFKRFWDELKMKLLSMNELVTAPLPREVYEYYDMLKNRALEAKKAARLAAVDRKLMERIAAKLTERDVRYLLELYKHGAMKLNDTAMKLYGVGLCYVDPRSHEVFLTPLGELFVEWLTGNIRLEKEQEDYEEQHGGNGGLLRTITVEATVWKHSNKGVLPVPSDLVGKRVRARIEVLS